MKNKEKAAAGKKAYYAAFKRAIKSGKIEAQFEE
jgi:hypothetical protein